MVDGIGLLALFLVAVLAGIVGAFLGVGGGIIIVPFITLGLGAFYPDVNQRIATAVSIVAVIATSSAAASVYVRDRMTNLRLGMWLEIATTVGAILGSLFVLLVPLNVLALLFAAAVGYAAYSMIRSRPGEDADGATRTPGDGLSQRLRLGDTYHDEEGAHPYAVGRPVAGLAVGSVAGTMAGLLGVGGGIVKVPLMNRLMGVPIRAAVATSNFMIGVTAAASAFVYYFSGLLDPAMAGVVVIGVSVGTVLGTRLMRRTPPRELHVAFAVFLAAVGILMALQGFGVLRVTR